MRTIRKKSSKARDVSADLDLSLRFKLFRTVGGFRQKEVAEALGVSVNYVSMLERGKREPTLAYLHKFARLVGVPLAIMLWDPKEKNGRSDRAQEVHDRLGTLMAEFASCLNVK